MSAAFLLEEVLANDGSTLGLPRHEATAPAVEAALVQFDGEALPALLLEDGRAVLLSFEQMRELRKAFDEWSRIFLRGTSEGRTSARLKR